MKIINGLFTSEAVSAGHPDKLCDRISDTVLDAFLALDPDARVACETFAINDRIIVAGEFKAKPGVARQVEAQAEALVRKALKDVGYGTADHDVDPATCLIGLAFNAQAAEISQAVDGSTKLGAGDQGIMFGYACDETPELMPLAWSLANALVNRAQEMNERSRYQRGASPVRPLRPDGKTQVTVRYEDGRPVGVQSVVVSWQHSADLTLEQVRWWLQRFVVDTIIPPELRTEDFVMHLNPGGRFTIGGPKADTGLTGRKIIVDTYGGAAPHGGGAFSGKDPSKVDRSGAYAARWIAKATVASGLARKATVQLSYAIGLAEPISIVVDTDGTATVPDEIIADAIREVFDLSPAGIIEALQLKRPIYTATSSLGHFGAFRDSGTYLWETTDRAGALSDAVRSKMRPTTLTERS
ncbi:methionine adenosyltransferase [Brevundimonas sp.]|uniref:methionine adenosyltransferase n=1 Tax=Brevundimonas sp. TaxID=1871086 RepID=UPI00289EE2E5|nr:methionine adenosyltransferase [Brevundimonas sp.]